MLILGRLWRPREKALGWVLVGLGNPGGEYTGHRHNIGFQILDLLAEKHRLTFKDLSFKGVLARGEIQGVRVLLLKPLNFMNHSGNVVAAAMRAYGLSAQRMLVIHDDLDLPLGKIRLRGEGGGGGHKGMESIIAALKTEAIPRLRVGIGRPPPGIDAESYVLSDFRPEEDREAAYQQSLSAVEFLLQGGLTAAMNRFN